jgi:hypothetical protein
MTYLLAHFWPGGTEEQYRATIAAVHAAVGQQPETFHAAGPSDGGFLIVATYESKAVCDDFVENKLLPLMPSRVGSSGRPRGTARTSSPRFEHERRSRRGYLGSDTAIDASGPSLSSSSRRVETSALAARAVGACPVTAVTNGPFSRA